MIDFDEDTESQASAFVDLTPLIDVVFQLLVFFLLTSAFIQPGISVDLPAAETGEVSDLFTVSVTISADGRLFIDERPVSIENFEEEIVIAVRGDLDVVVGVWVDAGVAYGRFMRVMDLCRAAGLRHVMLMVRQNQSQDEADESPL